jgi:HSP20 family molecular chaperone IbpA
LQLPADVEAGKIDANFKSGVLTVKLRKSAKTQKKQTMLGAGMVVTG